MQRNKDLQVQQQEQAEIRRKRMSRKRMRSKEGSTEECAAENAQSKITIKYAVQPRNIKKVRKREFDVIRIPNLDVDVDELMHDNHIEASEAERQYEYSSMLNEVQYGGGGK